LKEEVNTNNARRI